MKQLFFAFTVLFIMSCSGPEPRKPVKVKTGSFMKESVERNKELLALEEQLIQNIITKDSLNSYQNSSTGAWFYYLAKNETSDYFPKPDDLVTLTYAITSFRNDTIYSFQEIGVLNYIVDKQELFPGLRNSIKLLKEKETATFLFPSSLAFGYLGDKDKIGPNTPIKTTISILEIKKQKDSIQN